jgi:hypothetical protein
MSYEFDKRKKPTQIRYFMKCKVLVKEVSYADEQSTGVQQVTDKFTYLIPEESTQRTKFLMTWLPDTNLDCQELGGEIGHPVYSLFRMALWRESEHLKQIHLMVLTKATEDLLKPLDGKYVQLEVLGEDEDEILDGQDDVDMERKDWDKIHDLDDSLRST